MSKFSNPLLMAGLLFALAVGSIAECAPLEAAPVGDAIDVVNRNRETVYFLVCVFLFGTVLTMAWKMWNDRDASAAHHSSTVSSAMSQINLMNTTLAVINTKVEELVKKVDAYPTRQNIMDQMRPELEFYILKNVQDKANEVMSKLRPRRRIRLK